MIKLNESEAAVYELLTLKMTPRQIANTLNKSSNYIGTILIFLVRNGLATKNGRKPSHIIYKAIKTDYTVIKRQQGKTIPHPKMQKLNIIKKLIRLVGKDNLRFIINHHGKLPRSHIAEKVGIRKVDLNHIYIMLDKKGDDAA